MKSLKSVVCLVAMLACGVAFGWPAPPDPITTAAETARDAAEEQYWEAYTVHYENDGILSGTDSMCDDWDAEAGWAISASHRSTAAANIVLNDVGHDLLNYVITLVDDGDDDPYQSQTRINAYNDAEDEAVLALSYLTLLQGDLEAAHEDLEDAYTAWQNL